MFDETYVFQGKHANYVEDLVKEAQIFDRYLDVLLLAPIIGFLNNREADIDTGERTSKVFAEQIIKESKKLKFIYEVITLLDEDNCKDVEERINRAFRKREGEGHEKSVQTFNRYIRGGVEFLYKKILDLDSVNKIEPELINQEDCLNNYLSYIKSFKEDLETDERDEDLEELINNFRS